MTKTVKKRLQAVVALLVTLMIMVGIVPSGALNTTVNAAYPVAGATYATIYFDPTYRGYQASGMASGADWSGIGTSSLKISGYNNSWHVLSSDYYKVETTDIPGGNDTSKTILKISVVTRYEGTGDNKDVTKIAIGYNHTVNNISNDIDATYLTGEINTTANQVYRLNGNDWGTSEYNGTYRKYSGIASSSLSNYAGSSAPVDVIALANRANVSLDASGGASTISDKGITAVLYDYFSDYELSTGNDRSTISHSTDSAFDDNTGYGWNVRRRVPMYTFNRELSTAYGNNVAKGLYFGDFAVSSQIGDCGSTLTGLNDGGNVTNSLVQGLYGKKLGSNHELLVGNSGNGGMAVPFFNASWLTTNKLGATASVKFPFKLVSGYYVADSENYVYRYTGTGTGMSAVAATTSNIVYGTTSSNITDGDFFPFTDRSAHNTSDGPLKYADRMNYGFGMELTIPFELNANGRVTEGDPSSTAITFEFSGDDDVVVYVDDFLLMDIGGTHAKLSGKIDFAAKNVYVEGVGTKNFSTLVNDASFNSSFNTAGDHTLKMFYVERGLWESNLSIKFNMSVKEDDPEPTSELDISKTTTIPTADANDMWVAGSGNNTTSLASGSQSANLNDVKDLYEDNVKHIEFDVRMQVQWNQEGTWVPWTTLQGNDLPKYDLVVTSTPDDPDNPANPTGTNLDANVVNNYNVFALYNNRTAKWKANHDVENVGWRAKISEDFGKSVSFAGNSQAKTVAELFEGSWTYTNKDGTSTSSPSGSSNFGPAYGSTPPEQTGTYFTWQGTEDAPETVAFTNTLITRSIQLKKVLSEANSTGSAKSFTVKVTLSNLGGMNLEDGYTGSNRTTNNTIEITKTLTVANGQTDSSVITISGIPILTDIKVEETTNDSTYPTKSYTMKVGENAATNYTGASTTALSGDTLFTVTNTRASEQIDLTLKKVWTYSTQNGMKYTSIKFLLQKQSGSDWVDVGEYTLSTATGSDHVTATTTNGSDGYTTVWTRDTKIKVEKGATYRILEYANGDTALILSDDGIYDFEWKAKYNTTGTYRYQKTLNTNGDLAIVNDYTNMSTGMPKTGAAGVRAIVTFGAFAITIAGVALLIYRKKLQTVNIYAVKGSEKPKE